MADFQEQLRQYRQQKKKEDTFNNLKLKIKKFWMLGTGKDTNQEKCQTTIDVKPAKAFNNETSIINESDEFVSSNEEDVFPSKAHHNCEMGEENKCLKYILWSVYLLFWVTLYVIAIELQFGLVFLMLSALFAIYFNTRTGPKKSHEISAYSVFNDNCHSIDGTLKAEQFENEIRFGSASMR